MNKKTITDFLQQDYREFAMHVIENRALASVVDGFKPTQRKIVHGSSQVWKTGNEKPLKVFQLSGYVAHNCFYHHGDASLSSGIINMAQKFKNNLPLLEEVGQFGSLRATDPGAPRYIGTKLNGNFKLIYKDFELLKYKEEEGMEIEPEYFLPIIPMILVNGGSGIAVGFASNILNRNPIDVLESCVKVLSNKKIDNIVPQIQGFTGLFTNDPNNTKKWIIRGKFERVNTTTIKITELPPSMTYEKYEEYLDKLVEMKKIISYEDNCKDNINYTIKMSRIDLDKYSDDDIIKVLKLEESETEIYNTLDEHGNLKIFESVTDIIKYFVNFRLTFYQKRKDFILNRLQHELKVLSQKGKFIKLILDGKIIVNNQPKDKIISQIETNGLEKIDDSYDYLLRLPIYSLTKEVFEKLKEDFTHKKEEIKGVELWTPNGMYLEDLQELKKKLK
jgi:DNA topoisomerase-2